jgi:hypothetical protein
LAQACFGCGVGAAGAFSGMLPVISIGSRLAEGFAATGAGVACAAVKACGVAELLCEVQNQPPVAINVAASTLINIRPNALRMVTLSLIPKLKFAPPSLWERVVNAPQTPGRFLMSHRPRRRGIRHSIGHELTPMTGGSDSTRWGISDDRGQA